MTLPLEISFRDIESSPAVEERVRERAEKLERFFDRAVFCRVVIEAPHRHHHRGKLYNVRIHLSLPGRDLLVGHEHKQDHGHEDVYVAVRNAFNALERQLKAKTEKMRGEVKTKEVPPHGRVARLMAEEGYGFIRTPDGQEVYFHRNAVVNDGFGELQEGDEVRYVAQHGESDKGPQASTVTPVGKHHLPPVEKL
jgi:ribosomal subunit interface protein